MTPTRKLSEPVNTHLTLLTDLSFRKFSATHVVAIEKPAMSAMPSKSSIVLRPNVRDQRRAAFYAPLETKMYSITYILGGLLWML